MIRQMICQKPSEAVSKLLFMATLNTSHTHNGGMVQDYSDSVSLRMQLVFCQRYELKILQTGCSGKYFYPHLDLSDHFLLLIQLTTRW